MAYTNGESVDIPCPKYFHDYSRIVVNSRTVLTLRCQAAHIPGGFAHRLFDLASGHRLAGSPAST